MTGVQTCALPIYIIREAAKICGGGGGGRPDMAQAGGKDASKINDALKAVEEALKAQIGG